MVARLGDVPFLRKAAPDGGDERAYLGVREHAVHARLLHVDHLSAERKNRLGAPVAPLARGTACGVALHEIAWTATVAKGSSGTSIDTDAFWGIDYATFNYSSSNKSQHTLNFSISGTSAATTITCLGHIVPWSSNAYDFGSAAYKWRNIYGQAGIVNTSDRNEKFDITPLGGAYDTIFDSLAPVSFKFVENTSNRTHVGLIAQDVKDAVIAAGITTRDFAGYCEWENEDKTVGCGLRYSEFVAMNIHEIQKLKARVKELEDKLI